MRVYITCVFHAYLLRSRFYEIDHFRCGGVSVRGIGQVAPSAYFGSSYPPRGRRLLRQQKRATNPEAHRAAFP